MEDVMKRKNKFILIFFTLVILTPVAYYSFIHPYTYPYKKAINNGDIVYSIRGVNNFEILREFIDKTRNNTYSKIRVVIYTKEGFPVIFDLTSKNGQIICLYDNTRNKFGRSIFKKEQIFEWIESDNKGNYFLRNKKGDKLWFFVDN